MRKLEQSQGFSRKDQGRIFPGSSWVLGSISSHLLEPPQLCLPLPGKMFLPCLLQFLPSTGCEAHKIDFFLQNGAAGGFCQALAFQFEGFWGERRGVLHPMCQPAVSSCARGVCGAGELLGWLQSLSFHHPLLFGHFLFPFHHPSTYSSVSWMSGGPSKSENPPSL